MDAITVKPPNPSEVTKQTFISYSTPIGDVCGHVEGGVLLHTPFKFPGWHRGWLLPHVASEFVRTTSIQPAVWRRNEVKCLSRRGVNTRPRRGLYAFYPYLSYLDTLNSKESWSGRKRKEVCLRVSQCQPQAGRKEAREGRRLWLQPRWTIRTVSRQNHREVMLCISFLLLSNKLLHAQWLYTTPVH